MQNALVKSIYPLVAVSFVVLLLQAARSGEAWMFDPDFRAGRPSDVLHEGPPVLLRAQVDAYVDLVEAAFELALRPEDEQALRDALEIEYGTADGARRAALADLVAPCAALRARARAGDAAALSTGLAVFRVALDQRMTAAPGTETHQVLRRALARLTETQWPGTPPLSVAAGDAWLAMVEFVSSLGRNEDVEPTEGQRETVRRELALALQNAPVDLRERLRNAPAAWLRTKAAWDASDIVRRLALRWKAVGLLVRALPRERRIQVEERGDLPTYARAGEAVARTQSAYEAWANLASHPAEVLDLLDAWLGSIAQGEDHILLYR